MTRQVSLSMADDFSNRIGLAAYAVTWTPPPGRTCLEGLSMRAVPSIMVKRWGASKSCKIWRQQSTATSSLSRRASLLEPASPCQSLHLWISHLFIYSGINSHLLQPTEQALGLLLCQGSVTCSTNRCNLRRTKTPSWLTPLASLHPIARCRLPE